jgi:hypothetical protein
MATIHNESDLSERRRLAYLRFLDAMDEVKRSAAEYADLCARSMLEGDDALPQADGMPNAND